MELAFVGGASFLGGTFSRGDLPFEASSKGFSLGAGEAFRVSGIILATDEKVPPNFSLIFGAVVRSVGFTRRKDRFVGGCAVSEAFEAFRFPRVSGIVSITAATIS
jgi:hypothetical protein